METFFTKDKNFYKVFFRLMLVVALQNLVAYSVNMLDNMMLGSYDQNALFRGSYCESDLLCCKSACHCNRKCPDRNGSVLGKKKIHMRSGNWTGIVLIFSLLAAMIILSYARHFRNNCLAVHNITGYYYGRSDLS